MAEGIAANIPESPEDYSMSIRIFNTKSGRKEEFVPLEPATVGMYICGVTVYDYCHLGHARGAYAFDVIRRYFQYRGYRVRYVRNFTDIDDKIIERAREENVSCQELAEKFIAEYYRDMESLGIRGADVEPRATDHIGEIVDITRGLEEKSYAYEVDGDVYYRVEKFPPYGTLSRRNLEEIMAGARVDVDERKENPLDFALWKRSKEGEPEWDSPWGKGRPGWHIECSAMSMKYLGATFDIHGGGKDLIFPHHENEIAQSEAYNSCEFVRYWMHNGFVNVDREKMSKSLGNFFTIREILEKFDAEVVRLFLLSTHYRNPIDFNDRSLRDVRRSLDRYYRFLEDVQKFSRSPGKAARPTSGREADILRAVEEMEGRFQEAMDDDFNTAQAVGEVFRTVSILGPAVRTPGELGMDALKYTAGRFLEVISPIASVFGVFHSQPEEWRDRDDRMSRQTSTDMNRGEIERLIARRNEFREKREWEKADAVREELHQKGIALEDGPDGTTWRQMV
jgi:cysteinyl-tRNA synthetase